MKKTLTVTLIALASLAVNSAQADTSAAAKRKNFAKKHPRRAEVLKRANNQENKNNAAAVNGKITNQQAQALDKRDQRIKRQEQADAAANGGHITKGEQAQLNREENHVNQARRVDERKDANAARNPAAGAPNTNNGGTGNVPPSTPNSTN